MDCLHSGRRLPMDEPEPTLIDMLENMFKHQDKTGNKGDAEIIINTIRHIDSLTKERDALVEQLQQAQAERDALRDRTQEWEWDKRFELDFEEEGE